MTGQRDQARYGARGRPPVDLGSEHGTDDSNHRPARPCRSLSSVRVLIGIILGLSVTRLVSGIAALVRHPGRVPDLGGSSRLGRLGAGQRRYVLVVGVSPEPGPAMDIRPLLSSASTRRCTSSSARCCSRGSRGVRRHHTSCRAGAGSSPSPPSPKRSSGGHLGKGAPSAVPRRRSTCCRSGPHRALRRRLDHAQRAIPPAVRLRRGGLRGELLRPPFPDAELRPPPH